MRHFRDTCISCFCDIQECFHCYGHRGAFLMQQWGKSMRQLLCRQKSFDFSQKQTFVFAQFSKAIHHFWNVLNSWHWVFRKMLTTHLLLNPRAYYLATPSTTSTKPHCRFKFIFYAPHPPQFFSFGPPLVPSEVKHLYLLQVFPSFTQDPFFWNIARHRSCSMAVVVNIIWTSIKLLFKSFHKMAHIYSLRLALLVNQTFPVII